MHPELNRRGVLKAAGGAGLAAVFGAKALHVSRLTTRRPRPRRRAFFTPEVTEGPYWVEGEPDAAEHHRGQGRVSPLVIRFTILNAKTCITIIIRGRRDLALRRERRLFGRQRRDDALPPRPSAPTRPARPSSSRSSPAGTEGRTPHIHMKVSVGGNAVHTGQVFFNEAITRSGLRLMPSQ